MSVRRLGTLLLLLGLQATPALGAEAAAQTLSLEEAIQTAIARNTQVRNAYLDRVVQRFDLYVAESKFTPRFTLEAGVTRSGQGDAAIRRQGEAAVQAVQVLPTGARVVLRGGQSELASSGLRDRASGWTLNIEQPLLKGGGIDFTTASVRIARLTEQRNILQLKTTLSNTVVGTIRSFRSLVQSRESLAIAEQSLARSRAALEINRELVAAKRMAVREVSQSEADVARREVDLLSAENALDGARLALVSLINLDIAAQPSPLPEVEIPAIPFERDEALEIAFASRPDYQAALLGLEAVRIQQALARNGLKWDLSLVAAYGSRRDAPREAGTLRSDDWNLGLRLSIPLNEPTLEQAMISADVRLEQAERDLQQLRLDITVAVQNALRQAQISRRQIDLARQSRMLSAQNLETVTEKLKAGRASNFELVSYQNELVAAQRSELGALIGYLNDLTNLEQTLGIVLDRWGIELVERQSGHAG